MCAALCCALHAAFSAVLTPPCVLLTSPLHLRGRFYPNPCQSAPKKVDSGCDPKRRTINSEMALTGQNLAKTFSKRRGGKGGSTRICTTKIVNVELKEMGNVPTTCCLFSSVTHIFLLPILKSPTSPQTPLMNNEDVMKWLYFLGPLL